MNEAIAIKTSNLTKIFGSFGDNIAVDNLNLEIKKGELFGLVGPDGAGKTTIMRLLTAIMEPTSRPFSFPVLCMPWPICQSLCR